MKFSIPCILSLLVSALYNIVDHIFIGNSSVGSIGNTATTIVSFLFYAMCLPLLDPILTFFGAKTPESIEKAHEYGFIIVLGFPFI